MANDLDLGLLPSGRRVSPTTRLTMSVAKSSARARPNRYVQARRASAVCVASSSISTARNSLAPDAASAVASAPRTHWNYFYNRMAPSQGYGRRQMPLGSQARSEAQWSNSKRQPRWR
jgi:hypothetical protein